MFQVKLCGFLTGIFLGLAVVMPLTANPDLPPNLGFKAPAFMRGFFLLTDWDYNPSVVRP
jgi:hypothetical protein